VIPVLSEESAKIEYSERRLAAFLAGRSTRRHQGVCDRNGEFTVNIALIDNSAPVLGVVYVPVTGVLLSRGARPGRVEGTGRLQPHADPCAQLPWRTRHGGGKPFAPR